MSLTDAGVRSAKPGPSLFKLSDGGGLQLWITPDGAKRWRLAYRFDGKQRTLAIGVYPTVSLKDARDAREAAKKTLAAGRDPMMEKKKAKAAQQFANATTFDAIAAELIEKKRREEKALPTINKTEWLLRLASTHIGARPISEIGAPDILGVLRVVEARGKLESAKRLRATIGQVFRYAVATGRAMGDPTPALQGAIASPIVTHRAAIIDAKGFGALLRAIRSYQGAPETRLAMELLALTFVRPGELRAAEWAEFDLPAAIWVIPADKMKMRRPHRVSLTPRVLEILDELRPLTGHGRFLFPSIRSGSRCMSENTIVGALRRMGYAKEEMSAHGFRSAASSMLNECGLWNPDAIEAQLAHIDANSVRRAYARADYWDERVRMLTWWAQRCEEMAAKVIATEMQEC